jgi:hypothetical protein
MPNNLGLKFIPKWSRASPVDNNNYRLADHQTVFKLGPNIQIKTNLIVFFSPLIPDKSLCGKQGNLSCSHMTINTPTNDALLSGY